LTGSLGLINPAENLGHHTDEEALELVRPFSLTEIDEALMDMEVGSAPVLMASLWGSIEHSGLS
jgi:hypothetical protein